MNIREKLQALGFASGDHDRDVHAALDEAALGHVLLERLTAVAVQPEGRTMHPTVGRIVLYRLEDGSGKEVPAIVTEVHSPTCVSLQVFPHEDVGALTFKSSVVQGTGRRMWLWPPRELDLELEPPARAAGAGAATGLALAMAADRADEPKP